MLQSVFEVIANLAVLPLARSISTFATDVARE
jgi:hypothetical protein